MIEAIGLVKQYGDHIAVDHLDFTVEKGQVLGFLGPNGAGKSTTMNMLTGYISVTEGTIIVNGYDMLEEAEEAKKSIGYLPEIPPVYPDMTVTEYLRFATELKKVPKKDRETEVERVIGLTKLEPMRKRLIKHLSKGYRQRVGIAQALVGDPEVIIIDEPTVGLDPAQIIEIRELIRGLAKEHTVLLSSHIMQEISAVCDHIMIICHGKLVLSGTPEELQAQADQGESLEVSVLGTRAQLQEVLSKLSGITEITEAEGETEKSSAVLIKSDHDIRTELSAALAKAGLPIEKLVRHVKTLEDIFLEATAAAEEEYRRSMEEEEEYEEEPRKPRKPIKLPKLKTPNIFTKFFDLYFGPVLHKEQREEPVDPDNPRRRRRKSRSQIFKEVYLPPLTVCVCLILVLTFVIGSLSNVIERHRIDKQNQQSQLDASISEAEQIAAQGEQILVEAEELAAGYDYDKVQAEVNRLYG